ncbi:MAG: hypothetical protein HY866_20070 [Chloroflexi bacterium]|nr:hypothetical protein [Chloroflexota bacterium]
MGELIHDLFYILLDNLGLIILVLCVTSGVALGMFVWSRSRDKKDKDREVSTYAEALRDVTAALNTTTTALSNTQDKLREVHDTNIILHDLLATARQQMKESEETNKQLKSALDAERDQSKTTTDQLQSEINRLNEVVSQLQQQIDNGQVAHLEEVNRLEKLLRASETARLKAERDLRDLRTDFQSLREQLSRPAAEGGPCEEVQPGQEPSVEVEKVTETPLAATANEGANEAVVSPPLESVIPESVPAVPGE